MHYCLLVPAGRYNLCHLIRINGKSADKEALVEMTEQVKHQLCFWLEVLNVSSVDPTAYRNTGLFES